ncbi:MAG: lactonase family protein [Acidimicrobiia bacterium]|nr:lactonase family protein [Acidimicrobiia bacterium]
MTTLFVGSYAPADAPGIKVFDLDATEGFRLLHEQRGVVNPSYVALDPAGRRLFAVSETGIDADGVGGAVHAFGIDGDGGRISLTELGRRPSGGDHPCHIGIDRTGAWLAVSNYGSGTVSVLPVESDGSLGEAVTVLRHRGRGARPERQSGPHAHSATFCGDDRYLLVADLGTDRLMLYRFDSATGSCEPVFEGVADPGSGPRHIAMHPGGEDLFVVNELDNSLAWWKLDREAGTLSSQASVASVPRSDSGHLAADVHVSSAGNRVYVSNRGHDSIAVFSFEPSSGLRPMATCDSGGEWPRSFGLTPEGEFVIVANQHSGGVVALPVDPDGGLGDVRFEVEVTEASSVALT